MTENPLNIALNDMDGTLVDYEIRLRGDLRQLAGPSELDFDPWDDSSHMEFRRYLIRKQPGWWYDLPRIHVSHHIVGIMRALGFQIHVLTKGPMASTNAWTEKVRWVKTHLPYALPTITQDKSLFYGKILFDDYPGYMEPWLVARPRGLGLMLEADCNKGFEHPRVIKIQKYMPKAKMGALTQILECVRSRSRREDLDLDMINFLRRQHDML